MDEKELGELYESSKLYARIRTHRKECEHWLDNCLDCFGGGTKKLIVSFFLEVKERLEARIREGYEGENALERMAEVEHEQWIYWAKGILKSENISKKRAERWKKLFIPYSKLSENYKTQDRVWARKAVKAQRGGK